MRDVQLPLGALDPCPSCGAGVPRLDPTPHACDAERLLDFQVARERHLLIQFEARLGEWLATLEGRFEEFYAKRSRP